LNHCEINNKLKQDFEALSICNAQQLQMLAPHSVILNMIITQTTGVINIAIVYCTK